MFKKKSVVDNKRQDAALPGQEDSGKLKDKTVLKGIELYNDRWSSFGGNTGIVSLSGSFE